MREIAYRNLDEAMLMGMDMAMAHVRSQGQELAQATVDAARFLRDAGVRYE